MSKYQLPIETIISRLGYGNSENLVRFKDISCLKYPSHTVKVLFEVKPYAVYFLDERPFVLFFEKCFDEALFKKISKQVWNAQIPIVFFCDNNTVKVYNGTSIDIESHVLNEVFRMDISSCHEDSDFSYFEISSPTFWHRYSTNYSSSKLNEYLLSNITYLTSKLKETYHVKFATKLVLRLIFIRYLIDRGVDLSYGNFSDDIEQSRKELLRVIREKEALYDLFSYLKLKFNGNLFELGNEIHDSELTESVFNLLADFLEGSSLLYDGQMSMFALYDFNIIPVELISNIYEILLGNEARAKDNAFYTPNYLVEYILDKTTLAFLKENSKYRILDPACGSGVFLVDSYRRIVEENLDDKVYCEDDVILKSLLTENIYGIDINEEAIDITIFSLYLTVMDYKDPKTLSQFTLPNLKGINLFVSDFFDEEKLSVLKNIDFNFIIGNPPWGNVREGLHLKYCKERGLEDKQQNNEIGRSFVFRAKDFSSENTVCCFILHSKLLYNQKKPAKEFRRFLLEKTKIHYIFEMSSVRKLVFKNADAPAVIISFKYEKGDNLGNRITYTSVKPNIFFKLFNIIVIEKNDVKRIVQSILHQYDWVWKTIVYGFSGDLDLIINLKRQFPAIINELEQQEPEVVWGAGVQYHDGDMLDAQHLVGRRMLDSQNGVDHFFVNSGSTSEFSKGYIHRPREKALFDPPYVLTSKGIDCSNYKLKSAYCEDSFVAKETMYLIKGTPEKKSFLLNLVGLLNSSLYAYLNLMLGSSIGIEREQRFMEEVLTFPYLYSKDIVEKVDLIQNVKKQIEFSNSSELDSEIKELDAMVLRSFGLQNNKFLDYAINIQIPELINSAETSTYRKVSVDNLKLYSECFINQFSKVYNKAGKHISVVLYPDILNKFSVFELCISDEHYETDMRVSKITDANKELLTRFNIFRCNDRFYQLRDVIHFGKNSFFIVKLNYYKYWHPAIAELDLAEVIDQIMTGVGGEE